MGGSTEKDSGNTRFQGCHGESYNSWTHICPCACICDSTPEDGHGECAQNSKLYEGMWWSHAKDLYIHIRFIYINNKLDLKTQVRYIYCIQTPPHLPHLIILSASPSLVFQTKFTWQNRNKNKHSIWTTIELGPPVLESSTKISKFHAPTNSEHRFHKVRIEN